MSEPNQPYQSPQENDDLPPCCKKLSLTTRKLGFYATLVLGTIFYFLAIFKFFSSAFGTDISYMYAILAPLLTLLCPLWMNSFSQVISGLREPARKYTVFILLGCLLGLIGSRVFDINSLSLIFILPIILSGIWLSLSYYQNGQETLLEWIKNCLWKAKAGVSNLRNSGDNL